jgi:hypothetical protein
MKTLISYEFGEVDCGSSILIKDNEGVLSLSIENWAYGETSGSISTKLTVNDITDLGHQLINLGEKLKQASDEEDFEFQKLISEDEAFLKVLERLGE